MSTGGKKCEITREISPIRDPATPVRYLSAWSSDVERNGIVEPKMSLDENFSTAGIFELELQKYGIAHSDTVTKKLCVEN
jgi:hypothetical protein